MIQNHGAFICSHREPQLFGMMRHGVQITGNDEQTTVKLVFQPFQCVAWCIIAESLDARSRPPSSPTGEIRIVSTAS